MNNNKGFAPLIAILIVAGVVALGGLTFYETRSSMPGLFVNNNTNVTGAYGGAVNSTTTGNVTHSSAVSVASLSPSSGAVGTSVTITGSGFTTTGNNVHFAEGGVANVKSTDGTHLTFTVPDSVGPCNLMSPGKMCAAYIRIVDPGYYHVYVSNVNGESGMLTFLVTGTSSLGQKLCTTDADCLSTETCVAVGPYSMNPNADKTCWPKDKPLPPAGGPPHVQLNANASASVMVGCSIVNGHTVCY